MASSKDFIATAAVLDANEADLTLVLDFADMFEQQNPRFDRALFVQAATKSLTRTLAHRNRMLEKAKRGNA